MRGILLGILYLLCFGGIVAIFLADHNLDRIIYFVMMLFISPYIEILRSPRNKNPTRRHGKNADMQNPQLDRLKITH